jgi:UrcA family protein
MDKTNAVTLVASMLATLMTSGAAVAQQATTEPEVKIEASKVVTMKQQRSPTGIDKETVSVGHTVAYHDLDLSTQAGKDELQKRVQNTASAICKELGTLYPNTSAKNEQEDQAACVEHAVQSALNSENIAIASAEKSKLR